MAVQLIDNRYISLEDLRNLLQTKFGSGNFNILVGRSIHVVYGDRG